MDKLLQEAKRLAQQSARENYLPIKGRIAYVVSHGQSYTTNDDTALTQRIAQSLNTQGFDTLCFVQPGHPWSLSIGSNIAPEVRIDGVRYIHTRWDRHPKTEQEHLEAVVQKLEQIFLVYRPEIVLGDSRFMNGLPAFVLAKRLGLPFYWEVRNIDEPSPVTDEQEHESIHNAKNIFVAQQADRIFAVTPEIKTELIRQGIDESKIIHLPNQNDFSSNIDTPTSTARKANVAATELDKPIELTKDILWKQFDLSGSNIIKILGNVNIQNGSAKSGVIIVELFDKENKKISAEEIGLSQSEVFGGSFVYLSDTKNKKSQIAYIETSTEVKCIRVGLVLFGKEEGTRIFIKNIEVESSKFTGDTHCEAKPKTKAKPASEYKVAIIADEFTTNSFSGEFIALPIQPDNWLEIFRNKKPDMFFCESAWAGPDSKTRPWRGKVYASVNFKNENRKDLLSILEYCKKSGIPTIFWNKEDPTHHDDRVHDFVKTASLFDYVFTTAEECVESYKKKYGVKNAFPLPFATNPKLFSPVENAARSERVVFAGSWYKNHTSRCQEMEFILDSLIADGFKMDIYNRYHGDPDPLHLWPEKYNQYLLPSRPHNEMPEVYKSSIYGLNFNTVVDSSTMFARRVFELMSSNTLVISNYSKGVEDMFGDLVVFPDRDHDRLKNLSTEEIDKIRHRALHEVLEKHTYKQRWRSILKAIELPYIENDITLTFSYMVNGREQALSAISWYQQYGTQFKGAQLLLVADGNMNPLDVAKLYQEFNRFGVSVTSVLHANKYAIAGRYQPIETSHFVALYPDANISVKRIKEASLHLQYMPESLIALEQQGRKIYKSDSVNFDAIIIGKNNQFLAWLERRINLQSYTAYLV